MAATAPAGKTGSSISPISRGADGAPRRVLYAEDQISSRIVTKALLERMGFEVDAVDDGEAAVERARANRYDLILLDIEMPVMDGVTAARLIRSEIAACRDIPILALSAFLADSTEHSEWRDAFDTAVPKPANSNELQRAMRRAMERHDLPATGHAGQAVPVAAQASLWDAMQKSLPAGVLRLMAATAASEMQHIALALAAAREAGDVEDQRKCRQALKGLAVNFSVGDLVDLVVMTADEPRALNISAAFGLIEDWRKQHA